MYNNRVQPISYVMAKSIVPRPCPTSTIRTTLMVSCIIIRPCENYRLEVVPAFSLVRQTRHVASLLFQRFRSHEVTQHCLAVRHGFRRRSFCGPLRGVGGGRRGGPAGDRRTAHVRPTRSGQEGGVRGHRCRSRPADVKNMKKGGPCWP